MTMSARQGRRSRQREVLAQEEAWEKDPEGGRDPEDEVHCGHGGEDSVD